MKINEEGLLLKYPMFGYFGLSNIGPYNDIKHKKKTKYITIFGKKCPIICLPNVPNERRKEDD